MITCADSAPPTVSLRKNAREELRISVDEFRGHRLLNLRVWFVADDGSMRPGKQGIAVRVELAPDLAQAIRSVCDGA
jgi:hypothetical protein